MSTNKLGADALNTQLPLNGVYLQLRPLAADDIAAVLTIEQSVHSHPWSRQLFEDCLHSRQQCLLLCDQQTVVAYCVFSVAAGDAELLNIATAPQWQRRGLARLLLSYLLEQLTCVADTLYLEVRQSNIKAIMLYQELGLAEVGIRPNYYPSAKGREDAIIMAYTLRL
ncbi:ribosomal protein S18-alanine N-acetyltransferase [Gilvimarinus sp. 2_MG-2023]|uniref:ribosomal protein S18-alanine N-acetyltransferase n=1 Tax=Gilvimarinus sp. 2_MG-2023 TaxID=3062666 RepID=UPI0026E2E012|nr:ribosomal protein S18-alanine N-acetyltransferase [Gilvimarinus sp. 2_MG-2023]MDO6570269.1 ribosomal protein S18-alanine N-acetyltransferase [Gilvimarinus sp. 2_MG-2023]